MNVWEIHPALVHFPIALLLSAIAVDLFAWWRPQETLNRVAAGLLIAGAAAGWLAANFGLLAFYTVPAHTDEAHRLMFWHMGAAVTSLVLFTWLAIMRWLHRAEPVKRLAHLVGLVAAAFLIMTGALGGYIVYHGGAGVEPELLASAVRESHGHDGQAMNETMGNSRSNDMEGMNHGDKGGRQDKDMQGMENAAKAEAAKQPTKPDMKGMQHGSAGGEREMAATGDQATGKQHHHEQKPEKTAADGASHDEQTASKEQSTQHEHEATTKKPQAGERHAEEQKTEAVEESPNTQQPNIKGKEHQGHKVQGKAREAADQKHEKTGQKPAKKELHEAPKELPKVPPPDARAAEVPAGFRVDVMAADLTYPTSVEFDGDGTMYVAEGGYNYGDDVAPARVVRIASDGSRKVVADQLSAPVTDLLWHDGRLFISQRGEISMLEAGRVRDLVTDLPSFGDHHNNQLTVGPDGKLYFGQGTATNSGVVGLDSFKMGWLAKHPKVRDIPAKDIRLRGEERGEGKVQEFQTPDPLAMLADGMKHGDSQKQGMAGMDHGAHGKPNGGDNSDEKAPGKVRAASGKGHESNGGEPRQKNPLANASEFEANVQANRAKNQPSMPAMKGMDHGSGKQDQAKGKRPSMKGVTDSNAKEDGKSIDNEMKGKAGSKKMDHDMKGMTGGKGDHHMKGMDGEMAGMEHKPAKTSAFQPFGNKAPKDGLVRGETKANGTILRMDLDGSNLEVFAWGLRNPFGVMWGPDKKLYASDNGYDERGSRPIAHAPDLIWTIREDGWYGFPDYAGDVPVTDSRFKPKYGPAPEFLMRDHPPIEKPLATLTPHAGAAKFDFSGSRRFGFQGQMFLALVGDMNPITGQHGDRSGFEVVRVDPESGEMKTFFRTKEGALGPKGMEYVATAGPKRPVDVRFSPNGDALYVVDIGAMAIIPTAVGPAPRPFPRTGVVWRITRDEKP